MQWSSCPKKLTDSVLLLAALISLSLSGNALAHSEHDRARFVAHNGQDSGFCDNALRPCKSIAYAIKHANKGDRVLVASGEYQIADLEELFLLTSEMVPVMGGYNRFDHFLSQAPQLNQTVIAGVPAEFTDSLTQRGFRVINDGIGRFGIGLNTLLEEHQSLQQSHSSQACTNGKAGYFSCDNIDLVSHMALGSFSSSPSSANDIWGHVDLNTHTEYAIIGLKNGTAIVSLADPAAPKEVGIIQGSNTSWRDIKVYQWFDATSLRWKAHAYVSSEGSDKIQIIDLSQLPHSVSLAATDNASGSAHNIYISHVDYTTNTALDGLSPALHIVGQQAAGGAFKTFGLSDPKKLTSLYSHSGATLDDYTHDAASMVVTDERAQSSCQTSLCTVLMDFNESSMRLWNISGLSKSTLLADVSYDNAAYVHSGWWSEDKRYVFVHDELDEQTYGLNTTLRVFNIDDLGAPSLVKVWTGPTKAIDHNGYVRGNRYYMSNYQRGVTVLDITDPVNPQHSGYFDTFPASDGNAFNGAWGVYPYLPSGLILASDINSGLYVLRDNTQNTGIGRSRFVTSATQLNPGDVATVSVERPQGAGVVSVGYRSLGASAVSGIDFEPVSGRLTWAADDHSVKTIELVSLDSGKQKALLALVYLFDPQGGLALASPSYHRLEIGENPPQLGTIGFDSASKTVSEGSSGLVISVLRNGGSDGQVSVAYRAESDTAIVGEDIQPISGELVWADGDAAAKQFVIHPIDDALIETDESFNVYLTSIDGSVLDTHTLVVNLSDNDRINTAPTVTAGDDREVNAGETVTLTASGVDAENDAITYLWQQTSGTEVRLTATNGVTASFVAPSQNATLGFRVTATDTFGASSLATVTISVKAAVIPPVTPSTPDPASGGSLGWLGLLLLSFAAVGTRRG